MTHIGQKLRLGAVGLLRLFIGQAQGLLRAAGFLNLAQQSRIALLQRGGTLRNPLFEDLMGELKLVLAVCDVAAHTPNRRGQPAEFVVGGDLRRHREGARRNLLHAAVELRQRSRYAAGHGTDDPDDQQQRHDQRACHRDGSLVGGP